MTSWGKLRVALPALLAMLVLGTVHGHDTIPELPFPNEQDPLPCGIPQTLGRGVAGVLDGTHEGELVEPEVHLYDSHLRSEVVGHVTHDSEVLVTLFQDNPVLNFYYVLAETEDGKVRGWVPEPFLTLSGK
jgi:hypothetical protein